MNLTLTNEQAITLMTALACANLVALEDIQHEVHSANKQAAADPHTFWSSLTDEQKFEYMRNDSCQPKVAALLKEVTALLDANTPAGLTLEGKTQAYPGQKFSGMFGPVRANHPG